MTPSHADGSFSKLLASLARIEFLILDDRLRDPLTASQAHDLLEILDDRHDLSSTLVVTQVPAEDRHACFPDATLGEGTPRLGPPGQARSPDPQRLPAGIEGRIDASSDRHWDHVATEVMIRRLTSSDPEAFGRRHRLDRVHGMDCNHRTASARTGGRHRRNAQPGTIQSCYFGEG
jgi:hypothetical protein